LWERAREASGATRYAERERRAAEAGYDEAMRAAGAWLVALTPRQGVSPG
jgi:hypothetical protein